MATPEHEHLYSTRVERAGQAFTLVSTNEGGAAYKGVWDDGTPVWCVSIGVLMQGDADALAAAFEPSGIGDDDLVAVVDALLEKVNAYYDDIGNRHGKRQDRARHLLGKSPRLAAARDAAQSDHARLLGDPAQAHHKRLLALGAIVEDAMDRLPAGAEDDD